MIKEGKERKKQEEGRCVGEATVTHYFPHRRQRWSLTFLCLREFGREVPHSHPSCNTHTPKSSIHTDTHSPFKQNMAPLFTATFIHQKLPALPLHCLLLSFTPSTSSSAALGRSVCAQKHKSRHTHARPSLPLPLAIVLPLLLPLAHTRTHGVASGQLLHHKDPAW